MKFTCKRCSLEKSSQDFSPSQIVRGQWCRSCVREQNQTYYKKNKVSLNETSKEYHRKNKGRMNRLSRERWVEKKGQYAPARKRWAEENRGKLLQYYKDRGSENLAFVNSLKANGTCADCGESYSSYVMEFDHVRGEKLFSIGKMGNRRRDRIVAEIAKCELVCCACHRVRSCERRPETRSPRLVAFRAWIDVLKNRPCSDCGRVLPSQAMDFDHRRGKKVENITDMWSWDRALVLAELEKCELVCANCHRERTARSIERKAS